MPQQRPLIRRAASRGLFRALLAGRLSGSGNGLDRRRSAVSGGHDAATLAGSGSSPRRPISPGSSIVLEPETSGRSWHARPRL